jgi:hypothetical protein
MICKCDGSGWYYDRDPLEPTEVCSEMCEPCYTAKYGPPPQIEYQAIRDFVDDHYSHFGCYPMEVETDNAVYTYDQYMTILELNKNDQSNQAA